MTPELQAFFSGFLVTLVHGGTTLAILAAGATAYALLSPYKEFARAREGEAAGAVVFGGSILALAVPLSLSLLSSPSWVEILLWGVAVTALQLLVFRVIDLALVGLPARLVQGDVVAAGLIAATRLASAVVLGAAVAG